MAAVKGFECVLPLQCVLHDLSRSQALTSSPYTVFLIFLLLLLQQYKIQWHGLIYSDIFFFRLPQTLPVRVGYFSSQRLQFQNCWNGLCKIHYMPITPPLLLFFNFYSYFSEVEACGTLNPSSFFFFLLKSPHEGGLAIQVAPQVSAMCCVRIVYRSRNRNDCLLLSDCLLCRTCSREFSRCMLCMIE